MFFSLLVGYGARSRSLYSAYSLAAVWLQQMGSRFTSPRKSGPAKQSGATLCSYKSLLWTVPHRRCPLVLV